MVKSNPNSFYKKQIKLLKKIVNYQKQQIKRQNQQMYQQKFKCCSKKLYKQFDKSQGARKRKKIMKRYPKSQTFHKLQNLISTIGKKDKKKNKITSKIEVNNIICLPINKKMSEKQFFEGVEKSIKNINNNWSKSNLSKFKKILSKIDLSNITFKDDNPLSNLHKDLLIDALLSNDYNENSKDLKMLEIKGCSSEPLKKSIEFINPANNKKCKFNKRFIKEQILNNIGIINAYYFMILKFTPMKETTIDRLKNILKMMVDKTNIYFTDLPNDICGVTISNGDIYIRGDFLKEALGGTRQFKSLSGKDKLIYKLTAICKIYLTLLHEYAHKIHYLVRKEGREEDNFFEHSEEMNSESEFFYYENLDGDKSKRKRNQNMHDKIHLNQVFNESGEYFDRELYIGTELNTITLETANFFLFEKSNNYKLYQGKLQGLINSTNKNIAIRASNSKYKIRSDIIPRCYFSVVRNC